MTKLSIKHQRQEVNDQIFYVCLSNYITNYPAKDNFTPLEEMIEALCRVRYAQLETNEIDFDSLSEILRLCGYPPYTRSRNRALLALKYLKKYRTVIADYWFEGNRVMIDIDEKAVKVGAEGFTKVPFPFPKRSPAACNLWQRIWAWDTLKSDPKKTDIKRLCKNIGINTEQPLSHMIRDLERAMKLVNEHLRSLDHDLYKQNGIDLPPEFQMVMKAQVTFRRVSKQEKKRRVREQAHDDPFTLEELEEMKAKWIRNQRKREQREGGRFYS